jgi:anti-sigma B factor antagonist
LIEAVEVTESRIHIIRLKNIFDASTVDEFEKVMNYILARNFYKFVVDLSHVEFISSAGWGAFTGELRRVRQNQGDIKLAGMNPDVYDVFLLLELDSFITAFETVDEAIAAFSSPSPADAAPLPAVEDLEVARTEEFGDESAGEIAETGPLTFEEHVSEISPLENNIEDFEAGVFEAPVESHDTALPMAAVANESEAPETPAADEQVRVESSAAEPAPFEAEPEAPEPDEPDLLAPDDLETHDIRDPWILDEIDTLPEEDEMSELESGRGRHAEIWSEFLPPSSAFESPVPAVSSDFHGAETTPSRAESPRRKRHESQAHSEPPSQGMADFDATAIAPDDVQAKPPSHRSGEKDGIVAAKDEASATATVGNIAAASAPTSASTAHDEPIKSTNQTQRATPPKLRANGNLLELIRQIVFAHPHYGPTMIRRFLEARVEPPVSVSRSTVYRYLRGADLNTRRKRLDCAGRAEGLRA